jgi:hypothetical protein
VLFLFLGMFLHSAAAIILVVPIVMPLVRSVGIDPVHFGLIVTINLGIGQQTPAFGVDLPLTHQALEVGDGRIVLILGQGQLALEEVALGRIQVQGPGLVGQFLGQAPVTFLQGPLEGGLNHLGLVGTGGGGLVGMGMDAGSGRAGPAEPVARAVKVALGAPARRE